MEELLQRRLTRMFGRNHHFAGIHVFTPSSDIPDEYGSGPRLVVLSPDAPYSRSADNPAFAAAVEILRNRGDQPRQKQNRLVFLAPDFDVLGRTKDQAKTFLAWDSIVTDIESGVLNQDISHLNQSKRSRDNADQALDQLIRETWKWLIAPVEEFVKGKPQLDWEAVPIPSTAPNLVEAIEDKLREEEWVIYEWSPIHLRHLLKQWYFKDDVTEVSALKVWQDSCHYLYLPRLLNDQVFRDAIAKGVETEDYFGFASGKEGDRYLGFVFGQPASIQLTESSLLIEREAALAWRERIESIRQPHTEEGDRRSKKEEEKTPGRPGDKGIGSKAASVKKQFYGTVTLDPIKAKMDFATLIDEVVQQFTAKPGVDVKISVEIQAQSKEGFDESLQRIVKENCNVLKFDSAEFEGED
ncbi:hypothetical protein MIT9_P0158 [Methylomarinovum caldicuralii]|uniref:Uncharacterized protein n=1 Tax=Methylomarinovum caldicuralii TaxID=438856 RepID=A0AAU9C828_9GAMM|nr:hypothetical protein [Methylomarinovum caldicuralii]BCX80584.1 hypothetical protein MIT9_P0158 [Methylomarinovum caldicuralii]